MTPAADEERRDRPAARWAPALLALAVLVFCAGTFRVHNLDIWLHARTGEWILEHGRVPSTNVLSELHADHPSVHDKWLFQVAAHVLLDDLGPDAVIAARLLLMLLLFGTMAATARGLGAGPWATLAACALALLAGRMRFLFRPDLVSMLLLVVFAHVLLVRRPDGRGAWRVLLPLQVLWANVHGYFLLGWLAVLALAAGRLVQRRVDVTRRLLLLAALLCASCLLNPAGLDGWLHPFAILADLRAHAEFYRSTIVEFAPTFGFDPRDSLDRTAFVLLAVVTTALLLAHLVTRARRGAAASDATRRDAEGLAASARGPSAFDDACWPALALLVLLGAMVPSLRRNMAPFAFVAAPLAAAAAGARFGPRVPGRLVALLLVVVVAWGELTDTTSVHDGLERRTGLGLSRIAYPDEGIAFFARELPHANVFTAFRFGSTFTGRRWPEQVASTNGNTHGYPTGYLEQVMAAVLDADRAAFDDLVRRYGHDAALLPLGAPLSAVLLDADDWTLVDVGVREAVFVRRDAVDPLWLSVHDLELPLRLGRPFPVPRTPCDPPLFGLLPRACDPLAERDTALLLLVAGFPEAADAAAALALEMAPDDPESLALHGIVLRNTGHADEARALLERSLALGGVNRLADSARDALDPDR
ncbi:MAG: hypothetical protein H6825_14650 [Planctomycetes bacterium]|nr:hypothetical protein [Planctomycetota bacterium]